MNNPIWRFFTSLRLTVVCLALGVVLVWVGTVAQADEGLYQAQVRYFKQWYVIGATLWGHHIPIVLPGGYLLGTVLLTNLVAAHIKRFKWGWGKLGIHLTHAGIVVLLVGQLATDMTQVESRMNFAEGETARYVQDHKAHELIFATDASDGQEQIVSLPEALVAGGGEVTHAELPFAVRVKEYHINGDIVLHRSVDEATGKLGTALATVSGQYASADGLATQAERAQESEGRVAVWREALAAVGESDTKDLVAAAKRIAGDKDRAAKLCEELKNRFQHEMLARFTAQGGAMRLAAERLGNKDAKALPGAASAGAGPDVFATALPEVRDMDHNNLPYAVIEMIDGGKSLGTWLMTPLLKTQEFTAGGKTWRAQFRGERRYLPFSLTLTKATHKNYAGSDTPKDFRSRVRIDNATTNEHREVEVSMNNPLRYGGLAFYQYQMTKDDLDRSPGSSVLQVVKNPSWLAPYIGCIVVAAGMLWQFLHHLAGFIKKRTNA